MRYVKCEINKVLSSNHQTPIKCKDCMSCQFEIEKPDHLVMCTHHGALYLNQYTANRDGISLFPVKKYKKVLD